MYTQPDSLVSHRKQPGSEETQGHGHLEKSQFILSFFVSSLHLVLSLCLCPAVSHHLTSPSSPSQTITHVFRAVQDDSQLMQFILILSNVLSVCSRPSFPAPSLLLCHFSFFPCSKDRTISTSAFM